MSGIAITYKRQAVVGFPETAYHYGETNIPDPISLPEGHQHDSDVDFPVIAFDFNETLTPAMEYPIGTGPFPGVKEVLDTLKSRGCCLHVTTSGLYYGKQDIPVFRARQRALIAWGNEYEIPIDFYGGKVPSDVYYDNDFVNVPKGNPDWLKVAEQIEAGLNTRFTLTGGKYVIKPRDPIGKPMPDDIGAPQPLLPRGYSTARLDVDFHKTLFTASSSQRWSNPQKGAVDAVTAFYNGGITIRLSCAGWSPLTHTAEDSKERFDGLVWHCAQFNVPYDRIVTKDFHHVGVDDKGITATDWAKDLPVIQKMLKDSGKTVPGLQWPA